MPITPGDRFLPPSAGQSPRSARGS